MIRKKLYFHRLRMYILPSVSEGNDRKYFSVEKERLFLQKILKEIKTSKKFMEFSYNKQSVAIEFVQGVDSFLNDGKGIICGKLSRHKDNHSFQLRTKGTATEKEIVVGKNQVFEARSYFFIDTDNMVIGYLNEVSAPSIKALEDWIYTVTKNSDNIGTIWCEVTGIATKDMINNLKKADYIGSISYNMEIPANLAVEKTNLSENEYKKLKNQKLVRVRYQLIADKRNKSTFSDKKDIGNFFNRLRNSQFVKTINVKMKSHKEDHVQEVRLINNPLNYSIDFDFDGSTLGNYNKIISTRIVNEYKKYKDEIADLYT